MYHSTRGKEEIKASLAIIKGISPDGGLYIKDLEKINIEELKGLNYRHLAQKIFEIMIDDFSSEEIAKCISEAYDNRFDTEELVKLCVLDNYSFLELYHGPTLAFKDMALTILPKFMTCAKKINNHNEKIVILTATSGDTGAAALNGFKDLDNCDIIVFYPHQGVSDVQMRQMLSYQGTNALVVALKGNFDDCQNFVKKAFSDENIANMLKKKNKALSSANSINIGRLIPQIVYYFYSYLKLVNSGKIAMNDEINFCVPTGNFGNILAGYYAKKLGLPIHKLICASNKNKILTDFLQTGVYDINREFYKTNSPSMDILISSNLERLLFELCENNHAEVAELMEQLKKKKEYNINLHTDLFYASYATEEETLANIKLEFDKDKYLMDTHTAVAYKVYQDYLKETNDSHHTVIVSTAAPYKFAGSVSSALGIDEKDEFKQIDILHNLSNIPIHPSLEKIRTLEPNEIVWSLDEAYDNLVKVLVGDGND